MLRTRTVAATAQALSPQECVERFTPLIWSLVSRFVPNESEAARIVGEVHQDLLRHAQEFIFPLAIDAAVVATITRRRLAQRTLVQRPLADAACGAAAAGPPPLSRAQQTVLGLGVTTASRVRYAREEQPKPYQPGLMKLRAALAQAEPLHINGRGDD